MAKSSIAGLTVTIGADTKDFSAAIKQIDAEAKNIAKDLKAVNDNLKLDPTNTQKVATNLDLLKEAAKKAGEKVDLIKSSINKLNAEYLAGKISADDYKTSMDHLKILLSQAKDEQDLANEKVKQFGKEATESGKSASFLGDMIKGNLISDLIKKGLEKIVELAKKIAQKLLEAGKKLVEFSKETVSIAAQYEDAIGYSEKVFGSYAKTIQEWVKANSEALRINISDLQVYANNLGAAFNALGLGHEQAVEFTQNILSLSADIRAGTGKDIKEIVDALTRGFTTSTKNFRQFGLYVTEADIKIQALKDGIVAYTGSQEELNAAMEKYQTAAAAAQQAMDQYGEQSDQFTAAEAAANAAMEELNSLLGEEEVNLSSAERATALYNLVMERMGFLVGQNEQEAGLYNSQIALMNTIFDNLKLTIGERLLPVFTDLVTKFNEFLQSDEGQAILNAIADAFENIGLKISEMLEDGTLKEMIGLFIEKAPEIVTKLGEILEKVIELSPKIFELTEKLLNLFGIETEASAAKKAFKDVKEEVEDMADKYEVSTDTMRHVIALFAEENGLKMSEIYGDWQTYAPQIEEYASNLKQSYTENLTNSAYETISSFAEYNLLSMQDIYNSWSYWEPQITAYAASLGTGYDTEFTKSMGYIQQFATDNGLTLGDVLSDWSTYEPQINTWMETLKTDTSTLEEAYKTELEQLPNNVQNAVDKAGNIDFSKMDAFLEKVKTWAQSIIDWFHKMSETAKNWQNDFEMNPPIMSGNDPMDPGTWQGYGSNSIGTMYVPNSVSNRSDSGVYNNTVNNNNSRSLGDVTIYLNSYGMNVDEVADELGAAFAQKIRMSGAML